MHYPYCRLSDQLWSTFVCGSTDCGELVEMGVKLLGFVAFVLNFSRLVEMYSCPLHAVLCSVWNIGINPTDWKRGLVVPLWKAKGDHQDCNNYRGVTLLSVPGKVFAWTIIEWVHHHLLEHQHPEQSGFTPKRSTIDHIIALQVLTKHR